MLSIDYCRVALVRLPQRSAQAFLTGGDDNEMEVVGHQAISPDFNSELSATLREHRKIERTVALGEKNRCSQVALMGDVMRVAREYQPCLSCHEELNLQELMPSQAAIGDGRPRP